MKKLLSLLLAITLVFALVACSNEKDTTSEPDTSTPTTQTETEKTDTNDTQTSETDTTDESSSDTETPSNSTPTSSKNGNASSTPSTSNKDNTTSSKPNTTTSKPTTSKPTETSKPTTSSTPTTSTPTEEKKPINLSYSMLIENNGIVSKNRADVLATELRIREDSNGNYNASYTIVGYTAFSITNISEQEKEAILNSAKNKDMLYDDGTSYGGAGATCLFSWDSSLLGYQYWPDLTYEKLVELGLYENITHDSNYIYLPSAFFGDTYVVCASNVSCSYDETTGKLDINGDFPFKDFYIGGTKQGNTYKINGIEKEYKEKALWT